MNVTNDMCRRLVCPHGEVHNGWVSRPETFVGVNHDMCAHFLSNRWVFETRDIRRSQPRSVCTFPEQQVYSRRRPQVCRKWAEIEEKWDIVTVARVLLADRADPNGVVGPGASCTTRLLVRRCHGHRVVELRTTRTTATTRENHTVTIFLCKQPMEHRAKR